MSTAGATDTEDVVLTLLAFQREGIESAGRPSAASTIVDEPYTLVT